MESKTVSDHEKSKTSLSLNFLALWIIYYFFTGSLYIGFNLPLALSGIVGRYFAAQCQVPEVCPHSIS